MKLQKNELTTIIQPHPPSGGTIAVVSTTFSLVLIGYSSSGGSVESQMWPPRLCDHAKVCLTDSCHFDSRMSKVCQVDGLLPKCKPSKQEFDALW
jgi:hypothetical protein